MSQIVVAALYRFVPLEDFVDLRQPIEDVMKAAQVRRHAPAGPRRDQRNGGRGAGWN